MDDSNLPPDLQNDSYFLNSEPLLKTCPDCNGDGFIVVTGTAIECCGDYNPDGSCCGDGIPQPCPEQRQCYTCSCTGEVEMSYDEVVHYLDSKKEPKDL